MFEFTSAVKTILSVLLSPRLMFPPDADLIVALPSTIRSPPTVSLPYTCALSASRYVILACPISAESINACIMSALSMIAVVIRPRVMSALSMIACIMSALSMYAVMMSAESINAWLISAESA